MDFYYLCDKFFIYNTMSTYREVVYMCLDLLKVNSDDSYFTEDHVIYLLNKFRSLVLKKKYEKELDQNAVNDDNYQTVVLDMDVTTSINGISCPSVHYLRSVQEIPPMLEVGMQYVFAEDFFEHEITCVSMKRFKYACGNKYLKNMMYATIGPDQHLYIKSANPQFVYLSRVNFRGMFDDADKASKLTGDCVECDILDRQFPMEESLIQLVVDYTVKTMAQSVYAPKDDKNNADDDLSGLNVKRAESASK